MKIFGINSSCASSDDHGRVGEIYWPYSGLQNVLVYMWESAGPLVAWWLTAVEATDKDTSTLKSKEGLRGEVSKKRI